MRILIVSQHFWPALGGAEVFLHRLATNWSAAGHAVTVLTTDLDPESAGKESPAYAKVRLPYWRLRWLGSAKYVRDVADWIGQHEQQFDVIYVSMLKHSAFAALAKGSRRRIPIVLRAEGAGATGDIRWQEAAIFGGWIRQRCRTADAVVAPSEAIRVELLNAEFVDARVWPISNGVAIPEPPWQATETSAWRKRLNLPDRPSIVFTGRLHEGKGIADLIESLPTLNHELADLRLLVVGEGPDRGRLEEIAATRGVAQRISWIGRVADVEPYLRAAELFILPSHHEGLSLSLLEAAALGMPAVASDIPANRDIANEKLLPRFAVGSATALAAAIHENWRSREYWAARGAELRAQVDARFSMDQVAQRHLELFHSLVAPV